ncbi:ATP-binding protein OS=Streptomyces alboniger OX=132473 GN=CP975_33180 PE=4 SV=1 [Streptomyces alboniger]
MSNQNRVIAAVTLAAATLALSGTAHAAAPAEDGKGKGNSLGRAVGSTLADPSGTTEDALKATKIALATAKMGLEAMRTVGQTGVPLSDGGLELS